MTLRTFVDFDRFHETVAANVEQLRLGAPAATGLRPLAFRIDDGRAYSFVPRGATIAVQRGVDDNATVIDLQATDWMAFATESFTRYGLLYNAGPRFTNGDFTDLCRWEPALRAAFVGRPVYDPAQRFVDRHGAALDLARSFGLDDDPADVAHFLQTTGYVHLRAVFTPDEVAVLATEVDRLVGLARTDDARSWWTRTAAGEAAVCQLKYGAVDSQIVTALHDDPRIRTLIRASGEAELAPNLDRNEGTKIIIKHPGATEGMTDLPLHTDCGMGFHPIACQMVLVGVQLERGSARGGQMHMTAGSHRATTADPTVVDTSAWPIVALETEPGDCTVHYSHTLHGAPPPTGALHYDERPRRTIYACFAPPSLFRELEPFADLVATMQRDDGVTRKPEDLLG